MEFEENGVVISRNEGSDKTVPEYTAPATKIKRVLLGSFVAALAASFFVSMIGILIIIGTNLISGILGIPTTSWFAQIGFWSGVTTATFAAAVNWYFGYLTVPAAWLALGLSIGRFPKRKITRPTPYYRWGAIWGAILVGATTTVGVAVITQGTFGVTSASYLSGIIGAGLMGMLIGAIAGLLCAVVFRVIVRPAEQVRNIALDVF